MHRRTCIHGRPDGAQFLRSLGSSSMDVPGAAKLVRLAVPTALQLLTHWLRPLLFNLFVSYRIKASALSPAEKALEEDAVGLGVAAGTSKHLLGLPVSGQNLVTFHPAFSEFAHNCRTIQQKVGREKLAKVAQLPTHRPASLREDGSGHGTNPPQDTRSVATHSAPVPLLFLGQRAAPSRS